MFKYNLYLSTLIVEVKYDIKTKEFSHELSFGGIDKRQVTESRNNSVDDEIDNFISKTMSEELITLTNRLAIRGSYVLGLLSVVGDFGKGVGYASRGPRYYIVKFSKNDLDNFAYCKGQFKLNTFNTKCIFTHECIKNNKGQFIDRDFMGDLLCIHSVNTKPYPSDNISYVETYDSPTVDEYKTIYSLCDHSPNEYGDLKKLLVDEEVGIRPIRDSLVKYIPYKNEDIQKIDVTEILHFSNTQLRDIIRFFPKKLVIKLLTSLDIYPTTSKEYEYKYSMFFKSIFVNITQFWKDLNMKGFNGTPGLVFHDYDELYDMIKTYNYIDLIIKNPKFKDGDNFLSRDVLSVDTMLCRVDGDLKFYNNYDDKDRVKLDGYHVRESTNPYVHDGHYVFVSDDKEKTIERVNCDMGDYHLTKLSFKKAKTYDRDSKRILKALDRMKLSPKTFKIKFKDEPKEKFELLSEEEFNKLLDDIKAPELIIDTDGMDEEEGVTDAEQDPLARFMAEMNEPEVEVDIESIEDPIERDLARLEALAKDSSGKAYRAEVKAIKGDCDDDEEFIDNEEFVDEHFID